jgi:anti-sigma B factor antagonist
VEVTTSTVAGVTVVALRGDLDSATAPGVQERLRGLLPTTPALLLDLTRVPYMSSAGLRTMLLLYRQAQCLSTAVGLVGVSPDLQAMMAATGFLRFFRIEPTVAEGVAALGPAVRGVEPAARRPAS